MSEYKCGKLPAARPFGLRTLAVYASGPLPDPPASVDVPAAPYPIDGNDRFGCCVMAGAAHLVAAWDKETDERDRVPDEQQVVETYFYLTGGADSGLVESSVLELWRSVGLFGETIAAYAPVDHASLLDIHQAVAFYGGSMLGIQCPASAQQQFAHHEPWTVVPGAQVVGGHCIVALGYTPQGLLCATWGGIAEVTYPFLARYLDEAWAIIPHQFVEVGKGPELDLEALKADLDRLAA